MATGRIIKTAISVSEQVNDISIEAALLFTWMIPHADDFGRMNGSARRVKALVVPMRDELTPEKVDKCLNEMKKAGLVIRYVVGGESFIQFPKWEEHQSGLHKRTKSKFPPPEDTDSEENGNSRNFPEIPSEQNRTEQKGTEQNGEAFELFWSFALIQYRKCESNAGNKKEAQKEFAKLNPSDELQTTMREALRAQADARVNPSDFVPHLKHVCRWIKNECWNDIEAKHEEDTATPDWMRSAL